MSGLLQHSPADVIRYLIIQLGSGSNPDASLAWPVYAAKEPNLPDNCITVFDTEGRDDGRTSPDGERQEFHGVQVKIRATTHALGWDKARDIAVSLDEEVLNETVAIGSSRYVVTAVTRTSGVLVVGSDTPSSNRRIFTFNAVVSVEQSS